MADPKFRKLKSILEGLQSTDLRVRNVAHRPVSEEDQYQAAIAEDANYEN